MKNSIFLGIIIVCLAGSILAAGCNLPGKKVSTSEAVLTSAAKTVSAQLTEFPQERTLSPSSQKSPYPTLLPPLPTITLAPTNNPATATALPCNAAKFESDEDIPDGAEMLGGTSFVKKWRIRNVGLCSWTSGYTVIFSHGDRMSAPDSVPLTSGEIKPMETVLISIPLKVPDIPGTYQGYFLLRSPDGVAFGPKNPFNDNIWVKINSVSPTATVTPTVTITPTMIDSHPDIQVMDLNLTSITPSKGQPVQVTTTITNTGAALAGELIVKWWANEAVVEPDCVWSIISLSPNQIQSLTCVFTGYTSAPQNVITKVFADANNNVIESNESNNVKTLNINVVAQ